MTNELTIKTAATIDISAIKNAALLKETKALADISARFNGLVEATAVSVETLRREQAPILYRIKTTKLYEKDGFKSMADYCKGIGLSDSGISGLVTAGKVYTDKDAPDALKALSVSKLAQMGSLLNDKDMLKAVYDDAKAGKLNDMTLAQVKDYTNDVKGRCGKVKATVVKTYTATVCGEQLSGEPATIDEWLDTIKVSCGNAVKVPDIDGHKTIVGYSKDSAYTYILTEYTALKADTGLKMDTIALIKIITRKVRRGEQLTAKEYELAYEMGLVDADDEDEDEDE